VITQEEMEGTAGSTLPSIYTGEFQPKIDAIIKKSSMGPGQANVILSQFSKYFKTVEEWKEKALAVIVTGEEDKDSMKVAREGRLFLKNIRCTIENRRVELKEESRRRVELIDGIAKVLKEAIEPLEAHLETQEKYPEVQRIKRLNELCDSRMAELNQFPWVLSSANRSIIGMMTDTMWSSYYGGIVAEDKRLKDVAAAEELARVEKVEKDKRRSDRFLVIRPLYSFFTDAAQVDLADLTEDMFGALQARLVEAKSRDEAAQKEKDEESRRNGVRSRWHSRKAKRAQAALDKTNAALDKIREENEAKERDRKAQEKKDKAAAKKLRMAPDKDKLLAFAKQIDEIRTPELSTEDARVITDNINLLLKKVTKYTRDQANKLDAEE
jgi:hypothetical protein